MVIIRRSGRLSSDKVGCPLPYCLTHFVLNKLHISIIGLSSPFGEPLPHVANINILSAKPNAEVLDVG
jgi:hypothetical protein